MDSCCQRAQSQVCRQHLFVYSFNSEPPCPEGQGGHCRTVNQFTEVSLGLPSCSWPLLLPPVLQITSGVMKRGSGWSLAASCPEDVLSGCIPGHFYWLSLLTTEAKGSWSFLARSELVSSLCSFSPNSPFPRSFWNHWNLPRDSPTPSLHLCHCRPQGAPPHPHHSSASPTRFSFYSTQFLGANLFPLATYP